MQTKLIARPEGSWLASAVLACALLAGALFVPLWRMELVAPQYPAGLAMYAYGYKFADDPSTRYEDVREINNLNHYIGMKPIEGVLEMRLFIPGIIALIAATMLLSLVTWMRRWLRALIVAGFWVMPLFFVADLQFWLYNYGHTMNPEAPLNTGSFTPKVFGTTHVWNFHSETSFQIGFYLMVLSALTITLLPPAVRWVRLRRQQRERPAPKAGAERLARPGKAAVVGAVLLALALGATAWGASRASAREPGGSSPSTLQARIDNAAPGDVVVVDGGVYDERIVIDKSLTLMGTNRPVIDGGGGGDVVTIAAADVTLSGFLVRGSGRTMSQEPAAIKVAEVDRATISLNTIEDSRFGIYLLSSHESTIRENDIDLGGHVPMGQRGYGIYLWQVGHTSLHGNTISNASDGIHVEFSDHNGMGENTVTDSRYGLHFMYADDNRVLQNIFRDNLAGAVLMFSHELLLKNNEFSNNRKGATGAGILFKDCDNVFLEGNRLLRNKYGLTIEGTPQSIGATAVFMRNLVALNDTGAALMTNAPITFVENAMIDNTVQVEVLGRDAGSRLLSPHAAAPAGDVPATGPHANHQAQPTGSETSTASNEGAAWTINGRGNYWSDYQGYDADGDGVGDEPYRPQPPFAGALTEHGTLRLFQFTLAQQAIDVAADLFPLYEYSAVIEDSGPLMAPPASPALPEGDSLNRELLFVSALLLGASAWLAARLLEVAPPQALLRLWRAVPGSREGTLA